jgi:hypothetical protein
MNKRKSPPVPFSKSAVCPRHGKREVPCPPRLVCLRDSWRKQWKKRRNARHQLRCCERRTGQWKIVVAKRRAAGGDVLHVVASAAPCQRGCDQADPGRVQRCASMMIGFVSIRGTHAYKTRPAGYRGYMYSRTGQGRQDFVGHSSRGGGDKRYSSAHAHEAINMSLARVTSNLPLRAVVVVTTAVPVHCREQSSPHSTLVSPSMEISHLRCDMNEHDNDDKCSLCRWAARRLVRDHVRCGDHMYLKTGDSSAYPRGDRSSSACWNNSCNIVHVYVFCCVHGDHHMQSSPYIPVHVEEGAVQPFPCVSHL